MFEPHPDCAILTTFFRRATNFFFAIYDYKTKTKYISSSIFAGGDHVVPNKMSRCAKYKSITSVFSFTDDAGQGLGRKQEGDYHIMLTVDACFSIYMSICLLIILHLYSSSSAHKQYAIHSHIKALYPPRHDVDRCPVTSKVLQLDFVITTLPIIPSFT